MRDKDDFLSLKKILHNVEIKNSAASDFENGCKYQMLAVVTLNDEIILRYTSSDGAETILKKIDWFCEKKKIIQAVAFDPSPAAWLLVLCIDNTVKYHSNI
jgi:hypothetical protein